MHESDDGDRDEGADAKVLTEAKKRFAQCEAWENHARMMFVEDVKFGYADSDNLAQWPDQLLTTREIDQKPTLTVNKTRIHCLQIINDAKQNKPGIVVRPTTNEATYEAAEVFEDVVRHIEYISRAQQAYDKASENQVFGGIGYVRVVTEYCTPDGFDQDILIRAINDPLTVYMDPDARERDRSDAEFAFVFDDMPKDKFKRMYPDHEDVLAGAPSSIFDAWLTDAHIRVAEYWRKKHKRVKIVSVVDPNTGERRSVPKDTVSAELIKIIRKDPQWDYRERDSDVVTVECFKIAGDTVIDRYEWPGEFIPIVPAIGEEVVINGQMDRKGHVRYLKDPQRIYNYNTSAQVEFGALQTKIPFLGPAEAFEGYEEYYASANLQSLGFLPYKHIDDSGKEIPPPKRLDPPTAAVAFSKGIEVAQMEMMMASGQYQSQFGQNENATSGKAINERQRQGDNATYHFVDNLAIMVRQVGRIVVGLIPKIYDTRRVLRIRGEDGVMRDIVIDPEAQQALEKRQMEEAQKIELIFNPNIGRYGVEVDIGPSYATRRQEAWNAIVQIITQSPQLIPLVGDLLFENADFPGADEIAQRLRRMAPPQALGDAPPPQLQAAEQQVQQLTQMIEDLNQKLATKDAETNIRAFEAETKRLAAIGNAGPIVTPMQAQPLIAQTAISMLQGGPPEQFGDAAAQAQAQAQQPMPQPMPGAPGGMPPPGMPPGMPPMAPPPMQPGMPQR